MLWLGGITASFADLTLNLVAVNGSEEVKDMDIKSYLPKELDPTDIIDAGGLTVQYDVDKATYFVSGKVSFQPKESKTFKIKVKDVWQISPEEFDVLKQQVDENLKLLEKKPNYESAKVARDKIIERLDYILAQQQNYSQDIERRIEQYRAYADQLKQIKDNVFSLDYLSSQSSVSEDENEASKTIKFMVEAKNPTDNAKTLEEKFYLPKEIRAEHIIDSKGLDLRFDDKRETTYLTKKEDFKPGETKQYEIIIKDIWSFPISRVDSLKERAQKAYDEIKDSMYAASGQFLFDQVTNNVDVISQSQAENLSIKEHIGLFRVNTKKYVETEDTVKKLEQLLAIVRAKKLEELESRKVKNILQKLKALRGLAALSEAIFKKGLSMTTVWRIIFGTLGFVAFFTTVNFFVWIRRSGQMGEDRRGKEPIKEVPKPGAGGATAAT
jgi:hypothetical protein